MRIERQLQGTLTTVFTELIKEKGLEGKISPYPAQEEHRADITLKNQHGKPIFFIELKDPTAKDGKSVFDSNVLMREVERAQKHEIKYFGNCNFLACAFFDKDRLYEKVGVNEGFFTVMEIHRLSQNYTPGKEVLSKLKTIGEFYIARALEIIERKPITFSDLDELFIFKIRKLIEVYAYPISNKVWEQYKDNKAFEKSIQKYAQSQLWNKPTAFDEIENLTHIAILMLISKLIFYKSYVDNQTWHELHPMVIPDTVHTSIALESCIWQYFETFKEVTGNFELLIGERADIIFKIPFVSEAAIDLVKDVLDAGGHYNFSNIPFDIIGRIFEELIREDERHKLGQYFTPSHVIDLINVFAIQRSEDRILDPSCGSGTFLVRAYERKKELSKLEKKKNTHSDFLNEIYGNDLSGYPAYLSMLNLAIRDTTRPSYPRISNKDFFAITENSKVGFHNQEGELENKPLPKFDAIIGNPPYTRQEDIGTMHGTVSKIKIQSLVQSECSFTPSQRTSIYSYFFYHSSIFLKDLGYMAFICQNSWLDTDYGIDMQRYLLRNYEIIAVMDSELERFFPSASVNTTIVICRKQRKENLREQNTVRFIYFTAALSDILKTVGGAARLKDQILQTNQSEVNDFFRIHCINQRELSEHLKWGHFLKAPKVYFDIVDRGKSFFAPLSKLGETRFGIKTGNNDFFIVKPIDHPKDEQLNLCVNCTNEIKSVRQIKAEGLCVVENGFNELWLIEKQFLFPMLTSPKDIDTYRSTPGKLPNCVLIVEEDKKVLKSDYPFVFSYIQNGEKKNLHRASTLANRSKWYNVGLRNVPSLSFNYIINEAGKTFWVNAYSNNNFHNIYPEKNARSLWLYLNSTLCWLIQQLIMRVSLGDGAGKIETYDLAAMLVPDIDLQDLEIDLGETRSYKEEFGDLSSLNSINPERRKLDEAILEAIGFTNKKERESVLLELYKATNQLISARLQKAQSMKGVRTQRNKVAFSVYVEQLKEMLIAEKLLAKNTLTFSRQLKKLVGEITSESKLQKKILDTYWKEKFGQLFDEREIALNEQGKLF